MSDQHQVLAVLGCRGDGGDHVLAGSLGHDPAERVIDEAELQQVGGERDQRDERRERGAGAAGQRIDGESQQQRRGGQQVRLEDRAGADEAFHLGVQTELTQGVRAIRGPEPLPFGGRSPRADVDCQGANVIEPPLNLCAHESCPPCWGDVGCDPHYTRSYTTAASKLQWTVCASSYPVI